MATTELNDTTIYYERSGQGPALLFVHGAFRDADNWADQTRRFWDRYTCVAYDRRGYTRSAPGDAAVSNASGGLRATGGRVLPSPSPRDGPPSMR